MRYLLFVVLVVFVGSVFGQTNTEAPATNNASGNAVITISVKDAEMDTIQLQEEKIKVLEKSAKKSKEAVKTRSEEPAEMKNDNELQDKSIQQKSVNSVSTSSSAFTLSKQQASNQRNQRSPTPAQQYQMDEVVSNLEENAPESFEYHYFKYVAGNYNVDLIEDLKKAEALKPTNTDVQIQMAAYNLIINDNKTALGYLNQLVESTRLSTEAVNYAEDLLLSAPENGTLVTHGFDDTYASAFIQLSKKVRTDVKLISLDFMQSEKYKKDLKNLGYKIPLREDIDVKYLEEFCTNNELKSIGISMTLPKEYLVPIQQNLFAVGLVFEYHKDLAYNNFLRNDYLWNNQLKKTLINTAISEKAKQLSANYLPMLLYLRKVYTQSGEGEKVKEIDKTIDKVSIQCKKYDQVQKLKGSY